MEREEDSRAWEEPLATGDLRGEIDEINIRKSLILAQKG